MMHKHHDHTSLPATPPELPDFPSTTPPEERMATWMALVRNGDRVPDAQLDRALVKLLEEIRLSL
jgi:hypothetical protein